MDVLVGPAFSIGDGPRGRLYVKQNVETQPRSKEVSSDSSSSIGAPDDSEEDDSKGDDGDGEEVQSKFNGGGGGAGLGSMGSFGSLEESLPIKRGLSNYFSGKSKSFASLSEVSSVSSVKEVEKRENPFNKRRRVLIASKWSRKSSSFYNWPNPKSMPLLALAEHEQEEEEEEDEQQQEQREQQDPSSDQSSADEKEHQERRAPKNLLDRRLKSFKSRSCYCLSDLQEH